MALDAVDIRALEVAVEGAKGHLPLTAREIELMEAALAEVREAGSAGDADQCIGCGASFAQVMPEPTLCAECRWWLDKRAANPDAVTGSIPAGVALISAMDDGIGPYVEFTDAWRDLSGEEQASKAAGWVRAALAASAGSGEPSELASEGGAHKSSPGNLPVGEVEAVAKAILDSARQENPDIPIHWTFYEDEARAAIAALDASRQRDPQELDPHSADWRDGFLTAKAEAQRDPVQLLADALTPEEIGALIDWPAVINAEARRTVWEKLMAACALGGVDD